jgi:hypothetical protein
MKWNPTEVYKCAILTVIAGLIAAILWRMPPKPPTLEQLHTARLKNAQKTVVDRLPVVFVQGGSISVDDFENPLPIEIEH